MRFKTLGSGPTVVKLAGLAGGVGLYQEEIEAAARAGFRVMALDTTGDRADDPSPCPLSWDSLSADVFEALDALGTPKAILWGTSFGCLVALAAAALRPDRVMGLLLCHPPDPWRRPRYQIQLMRWLDRRNDPVRATGLTFRTGFKLLGGWEALYPTTLNRVRRLLRANAEAATPASTVREKALLLTFEPPTLPPRGFSIPLSVVAGSWDTIAPFREARRLSARFPGARLCCLSFSGHSGANSRPRAYARLVLRELDLLIKAGEQPPPSRLDV